MKASIKRCICKNQAELIKRESERERERERERRVGVYVTIVVGSMTVEAPGFLLPKD